MPAATTDRCARDAGPGGFILDGVCEQGREERSVVRTDRGHRAEWRGRRGRGDISRLGRLRRRRCRGKDAGGLLHGLFAGADPVRPPVVPIALMTQEERVVVPTWLPAHRLLTECSPTTHRLLLVPRRLASGPRCSHMAGLLCPLVTRRQPNGEPRRGAANTIARFGEVPDANARHAGSAGPSALCSHWFCRARRFHCTPPRRRHPPRVHTTRDRDRSRHRRPRSRRTRSTSPMSRKPTRHSSPTSSSSGTWRSAALLTDGSAFCALLRQGGGIDRALVSEAAGVRNTESSTHLPLSVTTFNTIEAVALLTLCPSEQKVIPAADRSRIRAPSVTRSARAAALTSARSDATRGNG